MGYTVNEDGSVSRNHRNETQNKCHKCGALNIPVDAKYCPKCGELLHELSVPQKEKYNSLQKERESLSERYQSLITFYNERKQLYEQLQKHTNYEEAIIKSLNIIERNKEKRLRAEKEYNRKYIITAIICAILFIAIFALCLYWAWENQAKEIVYSFESYSIFYKIYIILMGVCQICICFFLCVLVFLPLIILDDSRWSSVNNEESYENDYTKTHLTPFIQKHEEEYELIGMCGLWYEICEPEKITQVILQKIEEIENNIKELDKEMQLLE